MRFLELFEDAAQSINWVPSIRDQHDIASGEAAIVWVDVAKFDKAWSKDYAYFSKNGRDGKDGRIVGRYGRFGEWLKLGEPVEMPIVSLGPDYKRNYSVVFVNGRHRFSWLRDHGAQSIPVVTSIEDADDMRELYGASFEKTIIHEARLDELRGIRNDPGVQYFQDLMKDDDYYNIGGRLDSFKVFTKWLSDNGYTPLGNGCFGMVFTRSDLRYAIKIFKNDPAYIKFVTLCQQRKNDPHLPKFRGKLMHLDNHFAVRVEKLIDIGSMPITGLKHYANRPRRQSSEEFIAEQNDIVQKLFRLYAVDHEINQLQAEYDSLEDAPDEQRRFVATKGDHWNNLYDEQASINSDLRLLNADGVEDFLELIKTQKGILETIDFLRDRWSAKLDIHSGNVMKRSDGTLVIIDPFYGD